MIFSIISKFMELPIKAAFIVRTSCVSVHFDMRVMYLLLSLRHGKQVRGSSGGGARLILLTDPTSNDILA